MKRIWVMTVGLLLGSSSSVLAEQTSSTSDYLKNMNQLYDKKSACPRQKNINFIKVL